MASLCLPAPLALALMIGLAGFVVLMTLVDVAPVAVAVAVAVRCVPGGPACVTATAFVDGQVIAASASVASPTAAASAASALAGADLTSSDQVASVAGRQQPGHSYASVAKHQASTVEELG